MNGQKVVDKNFCMSSFLSFKYVCDPCRIWKEGVEPRPLSLTPKDKRTACKTSADIDVQIKKLLSEVDLTKAALMLSGGIDSGIVASYMPKGMKAYTAHNKAPATDLEVGRAAKICEANGLEHVVVEITWDDFDRSMDAMMKKDRCPVSANEPQVFALVERAIRDGADTIIFGDDADAVFGGYDQMCAKDWTFDEWVRRYTFVDPAEVLREPADMTPVFEPYRVGDHVDLVKFIQEIAAISSGVAYYNTYDYFEVNYFDPFTFLKMADPLDLGRVRNGESKYLLRELYRGKYPDFPVPEKLPMPRSMNVWLDWWKGPQRPEFKQDCIGGLTYEQRFLVYSLERFLNLMEI